VNARRRYLVLYGLRWLPTGLLIPVTVLLGLQRGLSLAEYGSVAALQGITVMLLELPTGGLTDALGRRPVMLLAGAFSIVSLTVLTVAGSVALYAAYFVLQGVFRALDSGPLEAWYVDHALAADPGADIETGLSQGGVVIGVAVGGGALLAGGLVALGPVGPVSALTLPVVVAWALQIVAVVAVALLMTEDRPARGMAALAGSVRGVPAAIGGAIGLLRRSRVVVALVAVELFWGFGMVAFETLMPVRLSDLLGDTQRASALMGPAGSAAWLASALGAALIPLLVRRIGPRWSGAVLRVAQGATVAGMALIGGPAGVIAAYLLCYVMHGAANPVHTALLHRQVEGRYRASLVSLNSMVGQPAGSLGTVVLTGVATAAGTGVAMLTGAFALAAAAPLYLVRRRRSTVEFQDQPRTGISTPRALTPGGNRCSP
jgi:MFS transporter, DHA1 family, tetracycline resistance protein